jgi:hypothetical protein
VDKDVLKEFLEERGVIVVDTSVFLDELFSAVLFRKTTSISPTANKPSLTESASTAFNEFF